MKHKPISYTAAATQCAFAVYEQFTQDLLQALKPEHRKRLAGLIG